MMGKKLEVITEMMVGAFAAFIIMSIVGGIAYSIERDRCACVKSCVRL